MDPKVSIAVAEQESRFNPNATGLIGEVGLYQLRPEFVKGFTRKQLYSPEINIMVGVKRLAEVKAKFKRKGKNAFLAAYNCGEARAKKLVYPERFKYVVEVNSRIARMETRDARYLDVR